MEENKSLRVLIEKVNRSALEMEKRLKADQKTIASLQEQLRQCRLMTEKKKSKRGK
mgnify:CR=1 FL=1